MYGGWLGGLLDYSVSPSPSPFPFDFFDFGFEDLGLTITENEQIRLSITSIIIEGLICSSDVIP